MALGAHTHAEIASQPGIWREALYAFAGRAEELVTLWHQHRFDQIILTGCGSTYYASLIGAELLQSTTGIQSVVLPASELLLFPQQHFRQNHHTLLITVSREGKTRETIEAARLFRRHGRGITLTVTCTSESTLAQEADIVLAIDQARENSRAQTRSFSSMVLTLQALTLTFGGQQAVDILADLPVHLERVVAENTALITGLGENMALNQFLFLGSGPLYGVACEAMLKALETTLLPSMAFHSLEFLHGPKYVVTDRTLVVGLINDATGDEECKAIQEAQRRQAFCLTLSDRPLPLTPDRRTFQIALESGLSVETAAILYLPLLQWLVFRQSVARGLNPDLPGQRNV